MGNSFDSNSRVFNQAWFAILAASSNNPIRRMYLARYSLPGLDASQGLVLFRPDLGNGLKLAHRCWEFLLDAAAQDGFEALLRVSVSASGMQLLAGLVSPDNQAAKLEAALALLARLDPSSAGELMDSSDAHDSCLQVALPARRRLDPGDYRVRGHPVAAEFSMHMLLPDLCAAAVAQQARFVYQLTVAPLDEPRELERQARKSLLSLEAQDYVPPGLLRLQRQLAENIGKARFQIDEGFACSDSFVDYVIAQLEDECATRLADLGFEELSLQEGEDAEDWFSTGLHSKHLFELSLAATMSAAIDQQTAREYLISSTHVSAPDSTPPQPGASTATGPTVDVFISYSSKNRNPATAICHALEEAGIRCWMAPRDINPGEHYPEAIIRGLRASRVLVLVFSEFANLSPHVHREVERALSTGCQIIPFRLDESELSSGMEYLISSCHWLDAVAPPLEDHIATLVHTVRHTL